MQSGHHILRLPPYIHTKMILLLTLYTDGETVLDVLSSLLKITTRVAVLGFKHRKTDLIHIRATRCIPSISHGEVHCLLCCILLIELCLMMMVANEKL